MGSYGESEVSLPSSSEAVVQYECVVEGEEEGELRFSYPLTGLVMGMKALNVAKVCQSNYPISIQPN